MREQISNLLADRKMRNITILCLIMIGVFVTVVGSRFVTKYRSQASDEPASLLLSPKTLSLKKDASFVVKLILTPKGRDIQGVDAMLKYDNDALTLQSVTTTKEFSNELVNSTNTATGEERIVLVETGNKTHEGDALEIATVSFIAKKAGTAPVSLEKATVVALGSDTQIPLAQLPHATFTVTDQTDSAMSPTQSQGSGDTSQADLVPLSFKLTNSNGNVKSTFKKGEKIYTLITLTNKGAGQTSSPDGYVYTYVYPNSPSPIAVGEKSSSDIYLRNGLFSPNYAKEYGSYAAHENSAQYRGEKYFTADSTGTYTARVFMNYDHKATESGYDNNQLTTTYTIESN